MSRSNAEQNASQERDPRVEILDTLLTCPHRKVEDLIPLHDLMSVQDPIFYAHLGVWSQSNIPIKDHKELFIAKLFLSGFPNHREAAFVLLQSLPPYQVNRVLSHVKGHSHCGRNGKIYEKRFGKNMPRIMRTAVTTYLRNREANRDWFDSAALQDRKALLSLYCRAKVSPGNSHVRAVLFHDGEPDADSKFAQFKTLSQTEDPLEQARIIVENNIPYTTAVGAVKEITPTIMVALINNMTSQEILVNLNKIKKHGSFENQEVKELIQKKLEVAKTDKKVDALKASQVVKNVNLGEEIAKNVTAVSDERLKELEIKKSTSLFIDKSGSMSMAIDVAKHIGALISSRCVSSFSCYAFDRNAISIDCHSPNLSDWEQATKGIVANGGTAIGAPVAELIRTGQVVEQIVIVSDFEEMNAPYFEDQIKQYMEKFSVKPNIVLVLINSLGSNYRSQGFIKKLQEMKIEHDVYEIKSKVDYYSLPTLLSFLTRKSKFELVQEILDVPLPKREQVMKKNG